MPPRTHSPSPFSYAPDDGGGFNILDANAELIGWARFEADAQLFSASAEMLSVLRAIREANHGSDAAIRKAEGR
jgi:hypothetical protein